MRQSYVVVLDLLSFVWFRRAKRRSHSRRSQLLWRGFRRSGAGAKYHEFGLGEELEEFHELGTVVVLHDQVVVDFQDPVREGSY